MRRGLSSWTGALVCFAMLAALGCDEDSGGQAQAEPAAVTASQGAAKREAAPREAEARLVTLGGAVTEVVFALGHGDDVVGADTSSTWPPEVEERPRVGYYRKLDAEGILALSPTRILANEGAGPPPVIKQLEAAGVEIEHIEGGDDLEDARERILAIGDALGEREGAEALVAKLDEDLARVKRRAEAVEDRPRVLFIYARGPNVLMVSGEETAADEMLELAGAVNAVEGVEGFKPLTPEAVIEAAPEVIVAPAAGAQSIGGAAGVFELPGVAQTPAGAKERLVLIDDLKLLGFGPRAGEALLELQDGLGIGEARDGDVPAH